VGKLLEVQDLRVAIGGRGTTVDVVHGVSFGLDRGEAMAIAGESGSGKTLTCLALARLLPPGVEVSGGRVLFENEEVLRYGTRRLRHWRGRRLGFVFQDPATALDPLFPAGSQVAEVISAHYPVSRRESRRRAISLLEEVGIPDAARRARLYPHQLSGGMKQRVAIAVALAASPDILVADEPTTALDVTTEASVLDTITRVRRDRGLALLLVTHDLAVAATSADRICVMYSGRVVEATAVRRCVACPGHPYTEALMGCADLLDREGSRRLKTIEGNPPGLGEDDDRCMFAPRCPYVEDRCWHGRPPPVHSEDGWAACYRVDRPRDAQWVVM
jgi:oligopeptide/dipeptide ABC transporter ATP-binding protein